MSDSQSSAARFESAFEQVFEIYSDLKSTDGLIKQQDYGKANTTGDNPRLVKPSDQDFLCDVELACRRVLPTEDDMSSLRAVLTGQPLSDKTKSRIKQRVGRELMRRSIFPVNKYFQGKEIHRGS